MTTYTSTILRKQDTTEQLAEQDLLTAVNFLRAGELLIFPTETVYGIGAAASNEAALQQIFAVKGRPQDNPLILHISDLEMLQRYVGEFPAAAQVICQNLMPGPLTVILPKSAAANEIVTANLATVGLRMPLNPLARALISKLGEAIAAPSANISGKPSSTDFAAVVEDFTGKVPCIIDGGASVFGVESTIVDLSTQPYRILRPGAVSAEQINACLQEHGVAERVLCQNDYYLPSATDKTAPKAPGMKYRHYAPKAMVKIINAATLAAKSENFAAYLTDYLVNAQANADAKISAYLSKDLYAALPQAVKDKLFKVFFFEDFANNAAALGLYTVSDSERSVTCNEAVSDEQTLSALSASAVRSEKLAFQAANGLFAVLRASDRLQVELIIAEALAGQGMAQAYMNRLTKAETK